MSSWLGAKFIIRLDEQVNKIYINQSRLTFDHQDIEH